MRRTVMACKVGAFNEERFRSMLERKGVDLAIIRGTENSKYISEFHHNGANLGYRPFAIFYFRDPVKAPAFAVPAVDLHLAIDSTWIEDVRAYVMAEFFTDVPAQFYPDFFSLARDVLKERQVKNMVVGIEAEILSTGFHQGLEELLAGNQLVDLTMDLELVRMVKLLWRSIG